MRIVPQSAHPRATQPETSAPSAPGVHDTLRSNLHLTTPIQPGQATAPGGRVSAATQAPAPLQSTHPLEARLTQWRATQEAHKMESLRRAFGVAEPVRRGMERRLAAQGEWRPAVLGGSANVHGDILAGRDCELDWEDVFAGKLDPGGVGLVLGMRVLTCGCVYSGRGDAAHAGLPYRDGEAVQDELVECWSMAGEAMRATPASTQRIGSGDQRGNHNEQDSLRRYRPRIESKIIEFMDSSNMEIY
jgi:proteasome maturation protein